VDLGTITLTKVIVEPGALKTLGYLPENLTDGIEASGDPLIKARTQAYVVSYGRRTQ
jgi:catalase